MDLEPDSVLKNYVEVASTLDFITVIESTDEHIVVGIDCDGGSGETRLYALWPGVFLGINDFYGHYFPAYKGEIAKGIKMNFCVDGRCEIQIIDNNRLFIGKDDFAITSGYVKDAFSFPSGRYFGMELFFHSSAVDIVPDGLLKDFGINVKAITEKLCPNEESFVFKATDEIIQLFSSMSCFEGHKRIDWFRLKVVELLMLLDSKNVSLEKSSQCFFTAGQVEIATQVKALICSDLSNTYSVEKMAEKYSISASSLKKYFKGVYGQNISDYRRNERMKKALEELSGNKSVSQIAAEIGYENASKFAAAFKTVMGSTPLEYRRKIRCGL